ncbi:MAG: glutaredoxin family protein [Gammaproteobacteria bacterium]|nr:MAG: glutaredoxin family protein [Gammaproteobacteria bacterium]
MQAALEPWQERLGFRLEIVDIHDDDALEQRFGEHVPVLMEGDDEICHYVLDAQALRERFPSAGD